VDVIDHNRDPGKPCGKATLDGSEISMEVDYVEPLVCQIAGETDDLHGAGANSDLSAHLRLVYGISVTKIMTRDCPASVEIARGHDFVSILGEGGEEGREELEVRFDMGELADAQLDSPHQDADSRHHPFGSVLVIADPCSSMSASRPDGLDDRRKRATERLSLCLRSTHR